MGRWLLILVFSSIVTLAGWGQALAQDRYVDIPATEVRRMLTDEECPNTSAQGYGKRLESDKHRLCLALALYAHGCLPDPRCQRTGLAFASGFTCYQRLHGHSQPTRDRSAPRPSGDAFWPDDAMILRLLAGHVAGSSHEETVRATPQAPAHLEAMSAEAASRREASPAITAPERLFQSALLPFNGTTDGIEGSELFAQSFGVELVPQPSGGWRIGRVAVGSAAWMRFLPEDSHTGKVVSEVHFDPVGGELIHRTSCRDDACLTHAASQPVVDDIVRVDGIFYPLSFKIATPQDAPWVEWAGEMSEPVERYKAQLAFARTGLLFGDADGGDIVVIEVDPDGPFSKSGFKIGDALGRLARLATGDGFYVPKPARSLHNTLSRVGPSVSVQMANAQETRTIQRASGGVRFQDGVAFLDQGAPFEFASRSVRGPLDTFQGDVRAVLNLIHEGRHDDAQLYRRTTGLRGSVPLMSQDMAEAPVIAIYEAQGWWRIAADYGYARARFLGACGDVVPVGIETTRTVNGKVVGAPRESTLYFLRGLRHVMEKRVDEQQSTGVSLGIYILGGGWPVFFDRYGCGSRQFERMDREMTAFAQKFR